MRRRPASLERHTHRGERHGGRRDLGDSDGREETVDAPEATEVAEVAGTQEASDGTPEEVVIPDPDLTHDWNPLTRYHYGTGGGAIAGTLTIYVDDSLLRIPLPGVLVRVHSATVDARATTDARGLATLTDAGLTGPVRVTFTGSGYGMLIVDGLAQSRLAGLMQPIAIAPIEGSPQYAGFVSGMDQLAAAPDGGARLAIVGFISPGFTSVGPQPAVHTGSTWPQNCVVQASGVSLLRFVFDAAAVPDQTVGLFAVGGTTSASTFAMATYDPTTLAFTRMGFRYPIDPAAPGVIAPDQNIALEHVLDQVIHITVTPPSGGAPNSPEVRCFVGLACGWIPCAGATIPAAEGWDSAAPALAADLSGGTYIATAGLTGSEVFRQSVARGNTPALAIADWIDGPTMALADGVLSVQTVAHATRIDSRLFFAPRTAPNRRRSSRSPGSTRARPGRSRSRTWPCRAERRP